MTVQTSRRVTTTDIARSLGVSRTTVAFVLNDTPGQTISKATRERLLAEASRLGYRPHTAARALASGRSRIVLIVLPDWPLDFNLRRNIEEASLALDEKGYSLITYTAHPNGHARPLWEVLQPDVVVSLTPLTAAQVAAIRDAGVEHVIPDPDRPRADEYPEEGRPCRSAISRISVTEGSRTRVRPIRESQIWWHSAVLACWSRQRTAD